MKTNILAILMIFFFCLLCLTKARSQKQDTKQLDSASLVYVFRGRCQTFKKMISQKFVNFHGNELSLFGALNLSQQTINDKLASAPINYLYDALNSNSFKTGYTGGFRIDGKYNMKHYYSLSLAINKVIAGNRYTNKYSLYPFIDNFTHYKSDNQYTTVSIAAHYKKILPINDMHKYQFFAVFGPSLDYKISTISKDHLMNGVDNRAFINGDLGAEFNNNGYYILYAHYKLGTNLFKSAVPLQINRFEIGMSIKAKDLF